MKYCVCTDAVYMKQADTMSAIAELHALGINAYEFWFWWEQDLERLKAQQDQLGMSCVAICAKFLKNPGDPAEQSAYLADFQESMAAAKQLGCQRLIVQAGWEKPGLPRDLHRATLLDTLSRAADLAAQEELTLVLEPLNIKVDHAGYHLWDTEEAFQVIQAVSRSNVKLLFDIYHQQISCGSLADSLSAHLDQIGHIHCAGVPGRHEITSGEVNYPYLFALLKRLGYEDYVGLEYFTDDPASESIRKCMGCFVY